MFRLNVSRTQWAPGHGFFHTGIVSSDRTEVTYAYDCGALRGRSSSLSREISIAARRLEHLDLFFLSHFDYDHVSGVHQLAGLVEVDNFVIPLVSPEERFFRLAGRLANEDPGEVAPDSPDDPYWALLADPTTTLGQLSQNVVSIEPGLGLDLGEYSADEVPSPTGVRGAVEVAPSLGEVGVVTAASCNGDEVWIWATFVTTSIMKYATYFTTLLQRRRLIADVAELCQPEVLADLVLKKKDDLIRAYRETVMKVGKSHTLNLTSLMLYSGPRPMSGVRTYRKRDLNRERAEIGAWSPGPGWLACGDADFRSQDRVDEFNRVFAPAKRHVGTFAPSHHGSAHDWDPSLLDGFGSNACTIPVCVFGADGAYQHPTQQVVLEINARGGIAVVVGGDERSRWTEMLVAYIVP